MNLERRQKYSGQGRTISHTTKKFSITFDLAALNLFACYVISENSNIKRSHLINMRNLFDVMDLSLYKNDTERMERINFIKKGLEGRLVEGIDNPVVLIKYINGGIMENDVIDLDNFEPMNNNEIEWINQTVSSSLKYTFLEDNVDRMIDVATRFKAADYRSKDEIVKEMESLVDELKNDFRRNSSESNHELTFSLREGVMEQGIREVHQIVSSPNRFLKTGMQGLNELVGGGFESTRVYMLLGLAGVGKSFALLNIAYQIKKHNKDYMVKDPSKTPVIVILTMENTVVETVTRLFSIASSKEQEFRNYTPDQIINILRTEGELYLTDESPIDILIKFKPDKSVDTGYLYTLTEDLEDEGYEVICLIQDHIKRIRSVNNYSDIRLELGAIVNEFKAYAQLKDVVVITASHINREGARTIDDSKVKNEADLIRKLGRANVGESFLMIDNLDGAYAIEKEYDSKGQLYMGFSKLKSRVKTNRDLIYQPFVPGNDIKFIEDAMLPIPVFRDTLRDQVQSTSLFNNGINRYQTNLKKIELRNDEDVDNIFSTQPINQKDLEQVLEEDVTYSVQSPTYVQDTFIPFNPDNVVRQIIVPGIIYD